MAGEIRSLLCRAIRLRGGLARLLRFARGIGRVFGRCGYPTI